MCISMIRGIFYIYRPFVFSLQWVACIYSLPIFLLSCLPFSQLFLSCMPWNLPGWECSLAEVGGRLSSLVVNGVYFSSFENRDAIGQSLVFWHFPCYLLFFRDQLRGVLSPCPSSQKALGCWWLGFSHLSLHLALSVSLKVIVLFLVKIIFLNEDNRTKSRNWRIWLYLWCVIFLKQRYRCLIFLKRPSLLYFNSLKKKKKVCFCLALLQTNVSSF